MTILGLSRCWNRWGVLALLAAGSIFGGSLKPADVKVAGALDYGQTSDSVEYTGTPRYLAFVFNGNSGDEIEVTVQGDRRAEIMIADGALTELIKGTNSVSFKLPNKGSDLDSYYIVFRNLEEGSARFTVKLKKTVRRTASTI